MTPEQLIERLRHHGVLVQVDAEPRQAIRRAILAAGLEEVVCARGLDRRPIRYDRAYELAFNEPLVRRAKRGPA